MGKNQHSKLVKEHFDIKYKDYDKLIRNLIPKYEEMHDKVISLLNFRKKEKLKFLDLGVGTGQTALQLLRKFPNSKLKGIDISLNMINQAKIRLKNYSRRIKLTRKDIDNLEVSNQKYDACIAVLSIHHLNEKQKSKLFKKIYKSLKKDGIFSIGDLIKFDSKKETLAKENQWKKLIIKNLGKKQGNFWFENYKEEDLPSSVNKHLRWLKEAGFKEFACVWKCMNYAVMYGKK